MNLHVFFWWGCFSLFLVFQLLNTIINENRVRHLTNWTILYIVCASAIVVFELHFHGSYQSISRFVIPTVLVQTVSISTAMLVMQIQDNTLMESVEDTYGVFIAWCANIIAHYLMPIFMLIFCFGFWPFRHHVPTIQTLYMWMIYPFGFSILYTLWFDPHIQYPGDLDFTIMFLFSFMISLLCLTAFYFVNYGYSSPSF
jgi:hypothetical protein